MLSSMTGYGRATQSSDSHTVTVEIKSVNHRYLEINFNQPRQLLYLEEEMKKVIKSHTNRGTITVFITITGESLNTPKINVNWELLDQYLMNVNQIRDRYAVDDKYGLTDILKLDNVFEVLDQPNDIDNMDYLIISTLELALGRLKEMRDKEGQHLTEDFLARIADVEQCVKAIQQWAPKVTLDYQKRLETRMREYLKGHAQVDEERLLNEVAVYSDKANIDEELTRLLSHIQQFRTFLNERGPIGRKMDFLIQEMNREVNTIGSKASDIHIARTVVDIKSHLEKIREQVQNIE